MVELGRILIADGDETFLESIAELLRRQGYQCDCVPDVAEATRKLGNSEYDLLIVGLKMAGNLQLEFIQGLPEIAEGLPVIVVTSCPSLGSAIQSIELRVEAYLVKPLDFKKLLKHVRIAVEHCRVRRSVCSVRQRLRRWYGELENIEKLLKNDGQKAFPVSIDGFLELTFQNIIAAVSDLKHLTGVLSTDSVQQEPCHLFNCPKLELLANGLAETIEVLEKSKSAFKSKDLGRIRRKLEELVDE